MSRRACIGGRSRRRWLCDSVALCCSQVWLVIYPAKQEYRIYSVALPIFNTEKENTFQPTRSFLRWRRMPWPNSPSWLPWIFSFWYGKWGGPTKKTTFCKNGQLGSELPAPIAKLCWCWNILRKAATLIFLCLVLFWSSHHYDQHEASVRSTVCQDDMFGRWKLLIILHFLQTNGLTTDVIV